MALTEQQISDTNAKLTSIAALKIQWDAVEAKIALLPATPPASVAVIDEATRATLVQFTDAAAIALGLQSIEDSLGADLETIYNDLQTAYTSY